MAFDYADLRDNTVIPAIEEYGKDGELSVNTPPTGAEPYESQIGEPVLHPVRVLQTSFKKSTNNGTLIVKGDVLYMVSTKGVTIDPSLANRIIVGGVTYQVVRIDPLETGPVILFWYIHARK